MSGLMISVHLDEFTLLRYAVEDLDNQEREAAEEHLHACGRCATALDAMKKLDEQLREVTWDAGVDDAFPPGDPFAQRPEAPRRPGAEAFARDGESLAMVALDASERARTESGRILQTARSSPRELAAAVLSASPLSNLTFRFALLYAMQETGLVIAESPVRALGFALAALDRITAETESNSAPALERILPLKALAAQAHLLAGQARNWTGELEDARRHFEESYRLFGLSTGDDLSLAIVELGESQRRAFAGDPVTGLALAGRVRTTFEDLELEDYVARARVAEGTCLLKLGRENEALDAYRSALPVFHERELWSNYMGALSSIAATLSAMGRLDEARREYARALKSVSRERHAAWVGYIRNGLALVLLRAHNYRGAALAFLQAAQHFRETGNIGNALTADLYEVESWALDGNLDRAAQRFEIFRAEVARHDALDPAILRQLATALSGKQPDLEEVAQLRESAGQLLRQRFQGTSA